MNKATNYGKRHYGPNKSRRHFSDEKIQEMERMRYQGRMSYEAIAEHFETTKCAIEQQLHRNGNHYGDDRPIRAKPFDGWSFHGMDVC